MPKIDLKIIFIAILSIFLAVLIPRFYQRYIGSGLQLDEPNPSGAVGISPDLSTQINPEAIEEIKVFMVLLNDNGKNGKKIGCNDSVVPVTVKTEVYQPVWDGLAKLLSIKEKTFQDKYYNVLADSNLTVESVVVDGGVATIRLTGEYKLGGICDNPRFASQLKETALQFPGVTKADVFLNGKPLDEILSGK